MVRRCYVTTCGLVKLVPRTSRGPLENPGDKVGGSVCYAIVLLVEDFQGGIAFFSVAELSHGSFRLLNNEFIILQCSLHVQFIPSPLPPPLSCT